MDLNRLKQLSGLNEGIDEKISDIRGYGANWFYLVYDIDPSSDIKRHQVTLGDIIARVKFGAAVDIANGRKGFSFLHPELYPESDKEKAIADARARLAKVPE